MNLWIDDAVVVAVAGLLAKEGIMWLVRSRSKKKNNSNGKDVFGLFNDIKGQGKLTLEKVGGIEKEQGEIKITLGKIATEMVNFKEKGFEQDSRLDTLDQRFFDHIKVGG